MSGDGSFWYSGSWYEHWVTIETRKKSHEDQNSAWWEVELSFYSNVSSHHVSAHGWYARRPSEAYLEKDSVCKLLQNLL